MNFSYEEQHYNILFIGDNTEAAKHLSSLNTKKYKVNYNSETLTEFKKLDYSEYDLILLGNLLPVAAYLEFTDQLIKHIPSIPVIIMSDSDDDEMALTAIRMGVQDYLISERIDGDLLEKSILYAIERKKKETILQERENHYLSLFEKNRSVMLIIDTETGKIVEANSAASRYYGYSRDEFLSLNIRQINQLPADEIAEKMVNAYTELNNCFQFQHRLKNNEMRDVEVYSGPIKNANKKLVSSIIHDITERKKAEKALQDSEYQYKTLFESAGDSIFIHNMEGSLIEVNGMACDRLGYSKPELLQFSFHQLELPGEAENIPHRMMQLKVNGSVFFTTSLKSKHEVPVPVEISSRIINYRGSEAVLSIARDITKRRRAELSLRESEERFRTIFEHAAIGVALLESRTGCFVKINQKFCSILGYSNDQMMKTGLGGILFEKNLPVILLNVNKLRMKLLKEYIAEKRFTHKSGKVIWLKLTVSPMFMTESDTGYHVMIAEDITERKSMEKKITLINEELESKVVERTKDLEIINRNLKEEVSKRTDAETALKLNEEKYRTVADFTYNWETWISPEGEFVYVSPSCKIMTGYDAEEFVEDPSLIIKIVHHEDRAMFEKHFNDILNRVLSHCTIDYRIICKDGQVRWIGHRCQSVFNQEGRWIGQRGSNVDISERKQREQEIRIEQQRLNSIIRISQLNDFNIKELLDYALDESIALSESKLGYIYYYSEEQEEFTLHSWSKNVMKECTIRNPETTYHLKLTGIWGEVVRQRRPIIVNNFQASNPLKKGYPEGHAFLSKFMTIPVFNKGKIVAVAGVANKETDYTDFDVKQLTLIMTAIWDIAEHRKVEVELEEYRLHLEELINDRTKELERINVRLQKELLKQKETEEKVTTALIREKELNELKSRFVSMISHEYRTPLTGILSSTELIDLYGYKWTEEKRKEHLSKIKRSVEYMTEMLNDVLLINRVDAGRLEFSPENIDLIDFCRNIVNDIKLIARNKCRILFTANTDKITGSMDRKLLHYILNNLLTNAVNYSNMNDIRFELCYDGEYARFIIADNGIGIPEEDQPRLFEQFYRGKNAINVPGTGLGLSIVKSCVNLHQGHIEFISKVGVGTTFTVSLKLKPD